MTNSVEQDSIAEKLKKTFISHPDTQKIGETKFLEYNFWRSWRYAMDPDEVIEATKYINGPLKMKLKERVGETDDTEIVGIQIVDTKHGASESKYITEVDYLQEVLRILDKERVQENRAAIREFFSRTPGLDDNHRPEDL